MIRYARITVAVLLAALSLDSQALETGPLPLEALLDTYKVPVVLEEFEEAYPRLWRYARKPQADLEGRVPLQAVRATSSPRPSGVIRLDLMAHVLREAPHGPERDRLITQFLEDLDEQVRRNDENLPAWCLMETMANSVCYVHPVEPGLYADTVVRRFQAYVEGDDESLRCPAACFLLNVAFRWTAKQAEIVQCVEGQIPAPDASKTPADSVDDPDIFTWDGVCRQLRYLKGDIWSGFATGEQVPESEYAQMKTASAEDLFATYKSERPVSATRNVIAHLYRTDPHKRVRVPDEAFDYVCEHPEETGDLMDALLWPVRGQTTRAAVGADFERQIAKSVELLVEASLKDDRYTPTKGLAEGISRPLLARFLGRAVSGRMDSERGETMARRRSDFETAATYCGHETLHSRLLAYLEKSAPVEQRIRAVTYLHLAFDAFPKTARETHTRLMELLPALEKEYGVTRDAPEAKSGEGRLVALVREQVERASRTIRDAEEAGMPEGVTDLYWLVSFALCDGAPIEFFKEPPFEWRKPLSEIAQFAQRYNVGSLEALHGIEGLTIEEEGSRSWKALDEKRGLELEAREFSDDSLYVEVSSLSDNQAEQRRVSLIFRRDSRTLVQVGNGGRMWPGIGLILFHQNGKLKSLTYSDGGRGWFAGFDEDGEPVECYSVRLEDGKPFSK